MSENHPILSLCYTNIFVLNLFSGILIILKFLHSQTTQLHKNKIKNISTPFLSLLLYMLYIQVI